MVNKSKSFLIAMIVFLFAVININAQSLSYSGPNSYNITSPTHLNNYIIPSIERTPTGMVFGDSGNKFYMVGAAGDIVVQYALSTAYDFTTRGTIEAYFRVNAEESVPQDVAFNDVGTRMYIVGNSGDDITEYSLSTAWDVSTATFTDVFDARTAIENLLGATNGDLLTGMAFNNDGSKLYVADRRSDDVFEFDLSTNYDVSTAGAVVNNMPITGENNVRGIAFNNDGTELYVIGNSGDDVNTFPLSIAYDLSSVGTSSVNSLPGSPDNTPQAILLNDDGTTFYVAGSSDDEIKEYSLSTAYDFSSTITFIEANGFPTVEIAPHGMAFNNDGTKLFVAGDQLNAVSEIALSTPYDITTGRYTTGLYVASEETGIKGLAFNNTGTTLYIIGNNGDEINGYDLSSAYDLSSTITTTTGSPFSISAEDNNPSDIFFNNDGTKLYVLGNTGNDLNQYSLSPAYDIADATAANLDIAFPLNDVSGLVIDSAPLGMAFNNDGSKLFIAGNTGNDINEISLSVNFDLSTGTITNTATYSVASEETTITDVAFNGDGSKFFIVGTNGDDMNQYQTKGNLIEATANDGTIDGTDPLVITLTGDTFADVDADDLLDITTEFTIANIPTGLTPVFTLSGGDTVATLSFTGNAENHLDVDDIANLVFTFTNAAFTSSNAADVTLAVGHTNVMGIDFSDCPQDIVYTSSWSGGSGPGGAPDNTDTASGVSVQGDVTITADVSCACINIATGQTLTVADGIQLSVTGAVEVIGNIRLEGDAQLLQTHSGTKNVQGSGNLTIDQTSATTNIYQSGYWTSPVTTNGSTFTIGGTMKDGTTSTPQDITFTDIHTLDGDGTTVPITISGRWLAKFANDTNWTFPVSSSGETFNPGEGYNMKGTGGIDGSSTQNYSFVGSPNDGDYSLTIDDVRLYLIGNPYPSALDANQFITDNTDAIGGTLYFYESGTETSHAVIDYNGGYATYNGITGVPFGAGKTPGQYVPVGQAFFVSRDVDNSLGTGTIGSSAEITFNNLQRDFVVEGATSVFFSRTTQEASQNVNPVLKIGLEFDVNASKTFHRQLAIGFVGATRGFENGLDSQMFGREPTDFSLTVENKSEPYVIIGVEDFTNDAEIPLHVFLDINRSVSFSVDSQTNFPEGQKIYLIDYQEGMYYEIQDTPKQLSLDAGTYLSRFTITFKIPASLSTNNESLTDEISIFNDSSLKQIVVKSLNLSINKIEVYNLLGQKVIEDINVNSLVEIKIPSDNLKPAVYIVNIKTEKGSLNKKIVVE
ncbi:beta-propeller fold lactonase family protein [Pseudotenacibaculum sp. MALMAid0570]|uniref:beta-propeller fold lactonase family protein n=1 Tax=Pseudotenacibaculum sp. MALMAid0570 TaxID=3143938 RepID=UPI0032DFF27D